MATTNSGKQSSAREIFSEAIEKASADDRAAYLDVACSQNPLLRQEVEELLVHHFRQDSFMNDPAAYHEAILPNVPMTEGPGSRIGRYKLLEVIGEGGMGIVYMAEQEEPVRRRVALKIIKLGMDTRQVVARFEAERQALAMMEHPNIARVFDGGATESGRPYFVMELVQGIPINQFCDKNHFSAADRLKLFIPVCKAIQSAHQKGIIHRDLKPANILVTINAGQPVPKVIDFGVAKATNQKLTEKTLFTNYGMILGTPAYMSPEQAEMTSPDVDIRTDIYSLGVALYELLTGSTPFPEKLLRDVGYREMQRIIVEEQPERPSTRLSTMRAGQSSVMAKNRGINESALTKSFSNEVDWIVMKCLEKDRARRYETANELAMDIQRHLDQQPVLAAAPTVAYRLSKLFARHQGAIARTAFVAILAALTSAGALLWFGKHGSKGLELSASQIQGIPIRVHVVSPHGDPIEGASCRLIVGGYPVDKRGFSLRPLEENTLKRITDMQGNAVFRHPSLAIEERHILYIECTNYSGARRVLDKSAFRNGLVTVALFKPQCVTLRYLFQPNGTPSFLSRDVTSGTVTLFPMHDGSYRPPARAHFSFRQNKIVGSSGVLDLGIEIDQKSGGLYFGGSRGRFDHCTDLGIIAFEDVATVDLNKLVREREDTPIIKGHTYIYESNIYPPGQRTQFTGFDVLYAKILVESIDDDHDSPSPGIN